MSKRIARFIGFFLRSLNFSYDFHGYHMGMGGTHGKSISTPGGWARPSTKV